MTNVQDFQKQNDVLIQDKERPLSDWDVRES